MPEPDVIIDRLEDQIDWYDRKSSTYQKTFKSIKTIEIIAAAVIPFLAAMTKQFPPLAWITAGLGVLITILEGLLQLHQYQQNWVAYRSTCEALKHEKYLFLASAPPYAGISDPRALLAERVESLVSQEHAKWAAVQLQNPKAKSAATEP
jgi:hypothetical protein